METQVNSQSTCHLHSLICIALDQCSKFDFASQWLKRSSEILPIKAMLARAAWRRPDGADTSDLFNLYIYNYIYTSIYSFFPHLLLKPSCLSLIVDWIFVHHYHLQTCALSILCSSCDRLAYGSHLLLWTSVCIDFWSPNNVFYWFLISTYI